jgi:hypothetical protein
MSAKRLLIPMVFAALAACASNQSSQSESSATGTSRSSDVITAAELDDPSVTSGNLLQAIQRLRPRFLMTRGAVSGVNASAGSVHVSVDGGPLLTTDALNRLQPSQVREVRYLSAADAAQRFGTAAGSGGVIVVRSR